MRAVLVDAPEDLLQERHRKGWDHLDEVWEGVLHMVPQPADRHQRLGSRLLAILLPLAESRGLVATYESPIFRPDTGERDYRVPDLVVTRAEDRSSRGVDGRAELAVEVLSPNDETYAKIDFYAAVGVQELLVVDPTTRRLELFVLRGGRLHAALPDASGNVFLASVGITVSTVDGPKLRVVWPEGSAEI